MRMTYTQWWASKDGKRTRVVAPPEMMEAIVQTYKDHGYGISMEEVWWETE